MCVPAAGAPTAASPDATGLRRSSGRTAHRGRAYALHPGSSPTPGAINLNVHFHTLVPDGIFDLSGTGSARFVPLRAPTDEEVAKLLAAIIRKVTRAGLLDAEGGDEDEPAELHADRPLPSNRIPWVELLRRVFAVDVLDCPRCHGRLELIAYIAEATVARRILDHLGLASQAPPLAPARRGEPGESCEAGPDHDGRDVIYEE